VATSGTYSFSVQATDIVREAMLNVGAIGEAEVATAQEYNDCLRKLNMIVKQLMGKMDFAPGLKMWKRKRGELFLGLSKYCYQLGPSGDNWAAGTTGLSFPYLYNTNQLTAIAPAGQQFVQVLSVTNINPGDYIGIQYQPSAGTNGSDLFWTTVTSTEQMTGVGIVNLAAPLAGQAMSNAYVFNYTTKAQRPLNVVTAILRDVYSNDTPLDFMTLEDYEQLPNKTDPQNTSDPSAVYYEAQIGTQPNIGGGRLYIDCGGAQDVTKHLHLVFLEASQDFDNPGDNPEYPQAWYRPLCWALSREICGMFDAVWTQDMDTNYKEAMAMAKEQDAETTSFYFQPHAGSPYDS